MSDKKSFDSGLVAGMLLAVSAQAVHWLITPLQHPDAGPIRHGLVVAQAVVAGGVALYLIRARRLRTSALR